MRRTITRGLALAAITALGLTGPAAYAGAIGDRGNGPDTGRSHDHHRGHDYGHDVDTGYGPSASSDPTTPYDVPEPSDDAAPASPYHDTNTLPAPSTSLPTGSVPSIPSVDPSSPTPTDTPTPTPTRTTAKPSPTKPKPTPADVRLNVTVTGTQTADNIGPSLVRYSLRVRATGGEAHRVAATISVHPRAARVIKPSACHGGGATLHCRLGDLRGARELTFGGKPGRDTRRVTVGVTVTAANAPAATGSMVLVLRRPPRTPHTDVTHQAPSAAHPDPVTGPAAGPAGAPPAEPDVTVFSPPDAVAPQRQAPVNPGLAQERVAPPKPRLPVVAPSPSASAEPTPNGVPVTVRPVADGHTITDGSGMPTRTIFGILAAAASFVGLVTALALVRRRNET